MLNIPRIKEAAKKEKVDLGEELIADS